MILDRVRRGERLETYETERIRADGARIVVSLTVSPDPQPACGDWSAPRWSPATSPPRRRRRRAQEFLVAASRLLDSLARPDRDRAHDRLHRRARAGRALPDRLRPRTTGGSATASSPVQNLAEAARLEQIRRERRSTRRGDHPVAQVLRQGRPMIWRDLKAPEVIDKVVQSEDHRQLIAGRPLQLRGGGAADRPRPDARRPLLPPRARRSALRPRRPPVPRRAWRPRRYGAGQRPPLQGAGPDRREPAARPASAPACRGAGPRHLGRLRGGRRGDRDRRRPLRRAPDRGWLLDPGRRRRRQGQRRGRGLGRGAALGARPHPGDRRA